MKAKSGPKGHEGLESELGMIGKDEILRAKDSPEGGMVVGGTPGLYAEATLDISPRFRAPSMAITPKNT